MRRRGEGGATLIELAIGVVLMFVLIFGVIDWGWALSQEQDVRTAAREGARLAVVNAGVGAAPDARRDDLIAQIKRRSAELADGDTAVYVSVLDDDGDGSAGEIGESVVVCVRHPREAVSGMSKPFMSGSMSSTVLMRMEKIANFSSGGTTTPAWTGTCTA